MMSHTFFNDQKFQKRKQFKKCCIVEQELLGPSLISVWTSSLRNCIWGTHNLQKLIIKSTRSDTPRQPQLCTIMMELWAFNCSEWPRCSKTSATKDQGKIREVFGVRWGAVWWFHLGGRSPCSRRNVFTLMRTALHHFPALIHILAPSRPLPLFLWASIFGGNYSSTGGKPHDPAPDKTESELGCTRCYISFSIIVRAHIYSKIMAVKNTMWERQKGLGLWTKPESSVWEEHLIWWLQSQPGYVHPCRC